MSVVDNEKGNRPNHWWVLGIAGGMVTLCIWLVAELVGAAAPSKSPSAGSTEPPTFNRDIAPIIYSQCVSCHHRGEAAPFELVTYQDVKRRARQIVEVTSSRYMPPWLPAPGFGEFANARGLTDEQIALLQRWAAAGAPEGRDADRPTLPLLTPGWQLGPPDLVVKLPRAYTLSAEGRDIYRTFVLPNPLKQSRHVRAIEFRPGTKVVHHAFVQVDETAQSRRLDAEDPEPGFEGMSPPAGSASSGGYFLGWQPGRGATRSPEGLPWTLPPGADLIMHLHMQTSGKKENVQPSIGFYFTDEPATNTPIKFSLSSYNIDIPPNVSNHVIQVEYVLPVDVQVLGILPHAHYLGKELQGYGVLPDGSRQWLLKINRWDFNWQSDYRYARPVPLPKGTRLVMQYTYDNSAQNPRNPHQPPARVRYGLQSVDEMAELWLQILVKDEAAFETFQADYQKWIAKDVVVYNTLLLQQNPTNSHAHVALGKALYLQGQERQAMEHFRTALRLNINEDEAHYHLGLMFLNANKLDLAKAAFSYALKIDPQSIPARNNLGLVLMRQGKLDEAEAEFRRALEIRADDPFVRANLNLILQARKAPR